MSLAKKIQKQINLFIDFLNSLKKQEQKITIDVTIKTLQKIKKEIKED